ncbi:SocA family protein [Patescibacteria group bacterium]|nr:SocA family protein [Patescibacteria group bacterium]MBU2509665.1 SocA family protein [Patescibacteria group bacterium]
MKAIPETSFKKATQALNLLAEKKDGRINKMKAIKLIYLADRLHLRKYGRPIVGDVYWAMKLGPVGSSTKKIAELSDMPANVLAYAKKYIKPVDARKQSFTSVESIKKPDLNVFSKSDIECLEAIYERFSDKDQFELADLTHEYPEWSKHKKEIDGGKTRAKMDYKDFFADPKDGDAIFLQKKAELNQAKESFKELQEVTTFFAD